MTRVMLILPVYLRTEKTLDSLASLVGKDYSDLDLRVGIGVNAASPALKEGLQEWQKAFCATKGCKVDVHYFPENLGKGKALNFLAKELVKDGWVPDYVCSMDSDVIQVYYRWLKRMLDTFQKYPASDMPLGLVSVNMLADAISCNVHLPQGEMAMQIGEYDCIHTKGNGGMGGACFLIDYKAWLAVGGYYDVLYIGGNDAYMLRDLWEKGYRAILNKNIYILHPKPSPKEKGYMDWKMGMVLSARARPTVRPEDKKDFVPPDIEM